LALTLALSIPLSDSELFKRTSHIFFRRCTSSSPHLKQTRERMFARSSAVQIVKANSQTLAPRNFTSVEIIEASCTRVYIHTYTHSYRTNAYLFTLCTLVLSLEIKVFERLYHGADIRMSENHCSENITTLFLFLSYSPPER